LKTEIRPSEMGVFLCHFNLVLFPCLPYNVAMKDKELKVKVDDEFIEKVDYLQRINDYKNRSDTVRKVVEKEYAKEKDLWNWTPFRTWDDMPQFGGSMLVTIVNCFGQRFVTEAYIHMEGSRVGWYVKDIIYAENWKEADFRLSHNWKVLAWMPSMMPFKEKDK